MRLHVCARACIHVWLHLTRFYETFVIRVLTARASPLTVVGCTAKGRVPRTGAGLHEMSRHAPSRRTSGAGITLSHPMHACQASLSLCCGCPCGPLPRRSRRCFCAIHVCAWQCSRCHSCCSCCIRLRLLAPPTAPTWRWVASGGRTHACRCGPCLHAARALHELPWGWGPKGNTGFLV